MGLERGDSQILWWGKGGMVKARVIDSQPGTVQGGDKLISKCR